MLKRKVYNELLKWKNKWSKQYAVLLEGARRVGKSTIAEEFTKKEYKSYILIDFSIKNKEVFNLFNSMNDLNFFFRSLQTIYNKKLYEHESVIIFDEVQLCPEARQAIKHLVKDGRYDYIETGSLISIKQKIKNILIPSEEMKIKVYPMDFEEFCLATNDISYDNIVDLFNHQYSSEIENRTYLKNIRTYIAIGGMPQAVVAYTQNKTFEEIDEIKKGIIDLYLNDFAKIDKSNRLATLFKSIPSQLATNKQRFVVSNILSKKKTNKDYELIFELIDSQTVLSCNEITDPSFMLEHTKQIDRFKLYVADIGLLISMLFNDSNNNYKDIYKKLLFEKIDANMGYIYENLISQMITSTNRGLYYYTWYKPNSTHKYEIDFLFAHKNKIIPIEVKSGQSIDHKPLDAFMKKFSNKIEKGLIFSKRNIIKYDNNVINYPIYLLPEFLKNLD